MRHAWLLGLGLAVLVGCQLPAEQVPLKPLPEDGPPQTYADMVTRARAQATAANEAFYINRWGDLEEAAKGLSQTARVLSKATEVPAKHKDKLDVEAGDLGKDAVKLRDAAHAQEVGKATEALQRINLKVRELRSDD
jgi:hypothetical protein